MMYIHGKDLVIEFGHGSIGVAKMGDGPDKLCSIVLNQLAKEYL